MTNCRRVVAEIQVVVPKCIIGVVDRKRDCMCTCDSQYIVLHMKITMQRQSFSKLGTTF